MAERMASDPNISSEDRKRLREMRKTQRKQENRTQLWLEARQHELESNAESQRREREREYHQRMNPVRREVDMVVARYARRREDLGYVNVYDDRVFMTSFYI